MDDEKLDLVQQIGNEICEGCGEDRDCELEYEDCDRVLNAIALLDEYLQENSSKMEE